MRLHTLRPPYKGKLKKRIGRGGKRGTYSGRGMKGQRARAGHRIRPALRDLTGRIPKLRGTKFRGKSKRPSVLDVSQLSRRLEGSVVTRKSLEDAGFISRSRQTVKILGDGEITRAITVRGVPLSRSAKEKIIKAGGKVEE
ncbi:50S ribosomal protein L15 [Candidatus Wolfebacteria bacterium]|nr:50S ribosomal protein L15 [Candidatus Wolfebacteria bacterium]